MRYAAIFCAVFALYLYTLHPTVAPYRDSGDLVVAAATLGLAHPPGYPLYSLIGKAFRIVMPIGNMGYSMNVLSALFGAGAVSLLAFVLDGVIAGGGIVVLAAAFMLAGSPALWRLSQVSEMYSLNGLFGAILLFLAARISNRGTTDDNMAWVICASFVGAIACASHQTILFVFPAFAWLAWKYGALNYKNITASAVYFAAGLSIYLFLPLRSFGYPAADWGHPATLHNFFRVVTRADYGGMRLHPEESTFSWSIGGINRHILVYIKILIDQFTLPGVIFGLWGFWVRRREPFFQFCLGALVLSGPVFIIISNLPPSEITTLPILEPHMVLPNVFFAVFIAAGFAAVTVPGTRMAAASLIAVGLMGLHLGQCDYRSDYRAWDYGRNARATMQPGAMLYNPDDSSAFITAYSQIACAKRKDITVASYYRTRWGYNALRRLHPELLPSREIASGEELSRVLLVYNQSLRPVYADLPAKFPGDLLSYPCGIFYRLSAKGEYAPTKLPFEFYSMRGKMLSANSGDFFADHIVSYYSSAYNNLGLAFANLKKFDEASSFYLKALAVEPALNAAVNNLGTLAFAQGKYDIALKWFTEALAKEPLSSSAHFNRGCALKALEKMDDAVTEFTWAWEHDNNADAGNELGLIAMKDDPMRAAAIFQAVLQRSPNYLNAYYNMGLSLQKAGDNANARRAFEAYYTMTPDPRDKAEVKARLDRLPK